ncbi:MAG: hypothetical protein O2905_02135 [Proteobacteria bacterium]|nr:hypothetical protein [Pseudomonadota bacterium]
MLWALAAVPARAATVRAAAEQRAELSIFVAARKAAGLVRDLAGANGVLHILNDILPGE